VNIESILAPERSFCAISAASKKRAIEEVAEKLANCIEGISTLELYNKLTSREKIGTTAIGHGIAIPHCRLESCKTITGGIFTLSTPIDFGAFDDELVKVLFVLLVPQEEVDEHLQVLAMLAKRLDSEKYRNSLIAADQHQTLYRSAIADLI